MGTGVWSQPLRLRPDPGIWFLCFEESVGQHLTWSPDLEVELLGVDHVDLDELAIKWLGGWRDAGHH